MKTSCGWRNEETSHKATVPYIMNSSNAVEVATNASRIVSIAAQWYAVNSDIRRLWIYEAGEAGPVDGGDIYIFVTLAPVCDSDDISPIWLARSTGWRINLQRLIGRRVHLGCFDADTETVPCAKDSEHARACLVSIGWRDYGDDVYLQGEFLSRSRTCSNLPATPCACSNPPRRSSRAVVSRKLIA
jgi:hypothetical protein